MYRQLSDRKHFCISLNVFHVNIRMVFSHGDDGVDLEVADGDDDEGKKEDLAVDQGVVDAAPGH